MRLRGPYLPSTFLVLTVIVLFPVLALAQTPPRPARASASASASASAPTPHPDPLPFVTGPRTIDLGHALTLDLPEKHAFLPPAPAARLAEQMCMCNRSNENLLGLVMADGHRLDWFVAIRHDEVGYVRDDEGIDADALIASVRVSPGRTPKWPASPEVEWSQPPHYDRTLHQLVWGLRTVTYYREGSHGWSDNYNAHLLGRRGTAWLTIGGWLRPDYMPDARASATALLGGLRFEPGSRYEDFNATTDKVAKHGLVGLITGGTAPAAPKVAQEGGIAKLRNAIMERKLHIVALIAAGLIALGALLNRVFGKRAPAPPTPPA